MKCPRCSEEIVLARKCPYCGVKVDAHRTAQGQAKSRPRGRFRGPLGSSQDSGTGKGRSTATWPQYLTALVQYFRDPGVSGLRKLAVLAAALYVLHPIDLVPDLIFGFGWLDDVAVIAVAWRYLKDQLTRYLS